MQLLIQSFAGAPKWVKLVKFPTRIGRSDAVDLRLDDMWVSREHCEIDRVADRYLVRDLSAKHGTHLNGQRVDQCEFVVGDVIGVGMTTVVVVEDEPEHDPSRRSDETMELSKAMTKECRQSMVYPFSLK